MQYRLALVLFTTIIFSTSALLALGNESTAKIGVDVSNSDPKWGETITVSYVPPDSSVYAKKNNKDTIYCAAMLNTSGGSNTLVIPMKRKSDKLYSCLLPVPDSTSSIRLEICIPTDRVPEGITIFTCKDRNNQPPPGTIFETSENIDSAFAVERKLYPWNYLAYHAAFENKIEFAEMTGKKLPDSTRRAMLLSAIKEVREANAKTVNWYFALAELEEMRKGGDSTAAALIAEAVKLRTYDPLYNNSNYWNSFFAPHMSGGKVFMPYEKSRALAPLVEMFPTTEMAKTWLQRVTGDTLLNATVYNKIASRWKTTYDVDVLNSLAYAYSMEKSPLYNATLALEYINRAEESSRKKIGFYMGQNIFGSMGRIGGLMQLKGTILSQLGKHEEAIFILKKSLSEAKETYDKERIGMALGRVYATAKNFPEAERAFGTALSYGTRRNTMGMDEVYEQRKQNNESKEEYIKRIADFYSKQVALPALPDFEYLTLDGVKGSIKQHRGKTVVLDFWFISCPGCAVERQSMSDMVDSFKGDNSVVFLSVALDNANSLKAFQEKVPSKFPVVPDGNAIAEKCGVTGYPTHIILDPNGNTVMWELGGSPTSGDDIHKRVLEIQSKRK